MRRITGLLTAGLIALSQTAAAEPIYMIRHAEKAAGEDPGLTEAGRARAARWAEMLSEAGIAAVITTNAARTRETGEIIAGLLGANRVEVDIGHVAGVIDMLEFDYPDVPVLIVGHNETLPGILMRLRLEGAPEMADDEYARLFVTMPGAGSFATLRMTDP
jgi:broad specificity phosphatase PhoE